MPQKVAGLEDSRCLTPHAVTVPTPGTGTLWGPSRPVSSPHTQTRVCPILHAQGDADGPHASPTSFYLRPRGATRDHYSGPCGWRPLALGARERLRSPHTLALGRSGRVGHHTQEQPRRARAWARQCDVGVKAHLEVKQQRRGGVERVEDGHVPQRVRVDVRRAQQPRRAGRLEALCDEADGCNGRDRQVGADDADDTEACDVAEVWATLLCRERAARGGGVPARAPVEKKRRGEQRRVAEHDKTNATEQYLEPVRAGDGIDDHAERGVRQAEEEGQPARHQSDARPCSEQDACEHMSRVRRAARSEQQHRQPVGRVREADARRPVVHGRAEAGERHQAAGGVVVRAR
eukprot:scaffold118982_cov75-Phaeocystis_antarctica.AAC.1